MQRPIFLLLALAAILPLSALPGWAADHREAPVLQLAGGPYSFLLVDEDGNIILSLEADDNESGPENLSQGHYLLKVNEPGVYELVVGSPAHLGIRRYAEAKEDHQEHETVVDDESQTQIQVHQAQTEPQEDDSPNALAGRAALHALANDNACPGCNFTEAQLTRQNLTGANLSKAILHKANLINTNLSEADLSGANLSEAQIFQTNLSNANLKGANLADTQALRTNFKGANLTDANLDGARVNGANFSGATWTDGSVCATNSIGQCR